MLTSLCLDSFSTSEKRRNMCLGQDIRVKAIPGQYMRASKDPDNSPVALLFSLGSMKRNKNLVCLPGPMRE